MQTNKLLKQFHELANTCRSRLSFGTIDSWNEIISILSYPPERFVQHYGEAYANSTPTYTKLNAFLAKAEEELQANILGRTKAMESSDGAGAEGQKEANSYSGVREQEEEKEEPLEEELTNWLPPPNPLQKATLFKFQRIAAMELFKQCVVSRHSAAMLRATVGVGKTFMYCQVIRWLMDLEWHKKTVEPMPYVSVYPYLIVTKASIVEQTRRVAANLFGIPLGIEGLLVTNYDQLRASFGEALLHKKERTVKGESVVDWEWHELQHPIGVVWDECHSLKNESVQSEIGLAFNDIKYLRGKTYQIFSSASPFLRVSESKYFCLATGLDTMKMGLFN